MTGRVLAGEPHEDGEEDCARHGEEQPSAGRRETGHPIRSRNSEEFAQSSPRRPSGRLGVRW